MKLGKYIKIVNICFASLCLITVCAQAQVNFPNYPIEPYFTQNRCVGTIGEERGNRLRFHRGLDFTHAVLEKRVGAAVVALESGIVTYNQASGMCIGSYCYVHLNDKQFLSGDAVIIGDTIGFTNSTAHVHIQYLPTGTVGVTNLNNDDFTWSNPLNGIDMTDTGQPFFDGNSNWEKTFIRREAGGVPFQSNDTLLFGHLHVQCSALDPRLSYQTGAPPNHNRGGIAPYSIFWNIRNHKTYLFLKEE